MRTDANRESLHDVTAVVLSARPYTRTFPGVDMLVHHCLIADAQDLQAARFDSIAKVRTPFFFFLDDDDDLPANYPEVLDRCLLVEAPLVYTDEIIRFPSGNEMRRRSAPYSQEAHLADMLLVHHLVLCRTADAKVAVAHLPRGHYAPEQMLFWELAKGGAQYVPVDGYIWNRGTGMHTWPATSISQMRSMLWCAANTGATGQLDETTESTS